MFVGEDIDGEGHLLPSVGLLSRDFGEGVTEDKEFDLFIARGFIAIEEETDLVGVRPRDRAFDPRTIGETEVDGALARFFPIFGERGSLLGIEGGELACGVEFFVDACVGEDDIAPG